jgi:hypothetical protein
MKLYARIVSMNVNSSSDINIGVSYGWASTPDPTNGTVYLDVTPPNIITELTFNQAIADALVSSVNGSFGTSFVRTNVIFISGAVTLLSL